MKISNLRPKSKQQSSTEELNSTTTETLKKLQGSLLEIKLHLKKF